MRTLVCLVLAFVLFLALPGAIPASGAVQAKVKVFVQAEVTPAQVGAALGAWPHLASGVHFDWGLFMLADDGSMAPLPQVSRQRLRFVPGNKLNGRAVFAMPPGKHRLRLLVEAYVLVTRTYDDTIASTVAQWHQDFDLMARPGQKITLKRRLRPQE